MCCLFKYKEKKKKGNTGRLTKLLRINTGSKVMLKVNVDLQDYLINCETTNIWNIKFVQGSV